MTPVVLADHDNRQFWVNPVNIPVIESPDHVLGAISADSKIEGIPGCVVVIPDGFSDPFIALHNGVPDVNQVNVSLLRFGIHRFVTLYPAGFGHRHGNRRTVGGLGKCLTQAS